MPRPLAILLTLLPLALAAAPPPTTPPAATTAPSPLDSHWSTLLDHLASDSFNERQDAQKQLDKATAHDLPALTALAAKTSDPEVKSRILARIDALEVDAAVNPPPIDFDVDNGSIRDVADALGKATGISWRTFDQGAPHPLFTLHAKDQPLWTIFMALNTQHNLRLQSGGDLELWLDSHGPRRGDLEGPLLFYPGSLAKVLDLQSADQNANGDTPDSATLAPPQLEFSYAVIGDPRLKIAKAWPSEIAEVIDDKGNVLAHNLPEDNGFTAPLLLQQQSLATWPIPKGVGKTLTVKGTMKLSFIVSETTIDIPDMVKQAGTPIVLGNEQVVWNKFAPNKDKGIDFEVSLQKKGGDPIDGDIPAVRITLTDTDGRHATLQPLRGNLTGGFGMNPAAGPIQATLSIPNRTADRTFNFHFNNLPIP